MLARKFVFLLSLFSVVPAFAITSATCYPARPAGTVSDWNQAANWANAPGGAPGSCGAAGGTSISYRGHTAIIPPGVPGAAQSSDFVVVPSGYVVHVTIPVLLGNANDSPLGTALTIQGTDHSNYGAVVVDDGALLSLSGFYNASPNGAGVADIQQFGILQVMPGGALWVDTLHNLVGEVTLGGRFYAGCGDTGLAPTPFCTANAGAWVQATQGLVGTPGVFVGSNLPSLQVGNLVELTTTPQPAVTGGGGYGPPYSSIGVIPPTPAAAPPVMPTVAGSGIPNALPDGWPMCVVSVSPLELGFPVDVTNKCTGATAVSFADAGSGLLWLKKPAFVWGNPNNYRWNIPVTINSTVCPFCAGGFDALHSWMALEGNFSNAAGTGPGRPGDTSFSPSTLTVTSLFNDGYYCGSIYYRRARFQDVQQCSEYYLDENSGQFVVWGGSALSINVTGTAYVSVPNAGRNVIFRTPSGGPTAGNELLIENTNIQYLNGNTIPIFAASNYSSAVNGAHFRFEGNTVKNAGGLIQTSNLAGTASSPIPITNNAFYNSANAGTYFVGAATGSSYVDISNNYWDVNNYPITTLNANVGSPQDNPHWSVTNNTGNVEVLISSTTSGLGVINTFSDLLFQRNRLMFAGVPYQGAYAGTWQGPGGLAGHPAHFEWNYMYGMERCAFLDQYTVTDHNLCAWAVHHGYVLNTGSGGGAGHYFPGLDFEYNLNVEKQVTGGSGSFFDMGYNTGYWLDSPIIRNNTSTGNSEGGISLGDLYDTGVVGLVTNATILDNLLVGDTDNQGATGFGFAKRQALSQNLTQSGIAHAGNNILAGPGPAYLSAVSGGSPNMTNLSFNRFTKVTHNGGTLYNTDPQRNVTGIVIQNPTYTSVASGALSLSYNSSSDIAVAWNDGSGFGAAAELNWAGAGATFPITGAVGQSADAQLAMAGNWGGGDWQTGCPESNYLQIVSGPGAGHVYAIVSCTPGQLTVVPDATNDGVTSGSVAVIVDAETRLYSADGTNYVDIGVDPRSLPSSSVSDSGISLALTDYCQSGCAAWLDPQIPGTQTNTASSFQWQISNSPVFPIAPPLQGGSMEQAWTAATYRPAAATQYASSTGGCVGAVSCDGTYGAVQTISFPALANIAFRAAPVTLNASSSSGLSVTYTSQTPSVCSVAGNSAALISIGTCTITASQPGGSGYRSATPVAQSFNISQGSTSISWSTPAAITFGSALSSAQLNAVGSVPGVMTYNPPAGTVLSVGNAQTLAVTFTPTDSVDYAGSTASVAINVNPVASPPATASLVLTRSLLTRNAAQNIVLSLTLTNTGKSNAQNVIITSASIGGTKGTPSPTLVGSVMAGFSMPALLTFPSTTGASGASTTLTVSGTFIGGTFSYSGRIVLP